MKTILEIREKIIQVYNKIEVFLIPVVKLIIAFIIMHTLNSKIGYNGKITGVAIEMIVSLLCSFLPTGVILLFAAIFTLLHLYKLSLVVAVLGLILFLILYLLILRFATKESLVVAVLPILMLWKLPYVLPIILGLVSTPASAVAVACGIVVYCFLGVVTANATTVSTMDLKQAAETLKLIVDAFLANKGMVVVIAAFTVTIIVVYLIRKLPVKMNWEIAIGAGVVVQVVSLIVGDLIMDTGVSFANVILVTLLAAVIAFILKFFKFCVDFSRIERVQFEDDDYYYYVKAVPKLSLGKASNKSKKINRQMAGRSSYVTGNVDGDYEEIYEDDIFDESYDEMSENYSENYSENGEYYEDGEYYEENSEEVYAEDAEAEPETSDDYEELF